MALVYEKEVQKMEKQNLSKLMLEVNALRHIQKKIEEAQRTMTYVRWKIKDLGISSDIPAHVSLDLMKLTSLAKKEEEKIISW